MADGQPRVLLFTAHPSLRGAEAAFKARGMHAVRADKLEDARALLETDRDVTVAVLDAYRPAPYSFGAVYALLHQDTPIPTLLLLPEGGTGANLLLGRDLAAQDDVVRMPVQVEELALRVQALMLRAGLQLRAAHPAPSEPSAEAASGLHQGQVIVMFGPKGGVGRSTIATNLAVGLAQFYGRKVALIDADLWFGDLPVLLDVRSERTMAALAHMGEHLDLDTLREVLVAHPSGVQVVLAPGDPAQVETIPADLPARLASAYRSLFDFVIVDTHPSMEEYMLQLLEVADRILLVTTPELAAIRSTGQALRLAPTLGWSDKLQLVLNRANSGVHVDQLEATLGVRVAATVVSAGPRVVDAANRGQPVLLADPQGREQVTRDLGRLVATIAGEAEPRWEKPEKRGLLRSLTASNPAFGPFSRG